MEVEARWLAKEKQRKQRKENADMDVIGRREDNPENGREIKK